MSKKDEIDLEISKRILEHIKKKTRWDWERIADTVGVAQGTLRRIRRGEIGLSFQMVILGQSAT